MSGRLSATPQLGLDKSRHSAKKQPAPKPPVGSTGGYKPALSKSPSKVEIDMIKTETEKALQITICLPDIKYKTDDFIVLPYPCIHTIFT